MTFLRAAPAAFFVAFLSTAFSPSLKADEWDKKTTLTFSEPVEIPGVHLKGFGVLPPGTYVFKLLDSQADRHIVQIFSQDELTVYATILAIPNYRLKATDKTVITFNEGVAGKPEALRAWFYPGANWGEEFVYPKKKAVELAQVAKVPVLAVVIETIEVAKPEDPQVAVELKKVPVIAIQPTGETVEVAQVVQTTPEAAPPVASPAPIEAVAPTAVAVDKLPDTASSLPLIALCGLLALGGAFTIRSIRKRAL